LAEELGVEPGTLALAWLLTRPSVTAPIIGPRTRDQLDSCRGAQYRVANYMPEVAGRSGKLAGPVMPGSAGASASAGPIAASYRAW
jgi:NDP-hexose 2,3-enoyl reductase